MQGYVEGMGSQMQFAEETQIGCQGIGFPTCSDASLEEILHLITDYGYAPAYPNLYDQDYSSNSKLTQAMDAARGNVFCLVFLFQL